MANAKAKVDFSNTYWTHKGKYPEINAALEKLVPAQNEVKDAANNPALERFRIASNCYYDLYNNGLCNRKAEFRKVFGFASEHTYGDRLTQALIDKTEDAMNDIILAAAKEQWIAAESNDALERLRHALKDAIRWLDAIESGVGNHTLVNLMPNNCIGRNDMRRVLEQTQPESSTAILNHQLRESIAAEDAKCLCVVGCSVNGECPLHGDAVADFPTKEPRLKELDALSWKRYGRPFVELDADTRKELREDLYDDNKTGQALFVTRGDGRRVRVTVPEKE